MTRAALLTLKLDHTSVVIIAQMSRKPQILWINLHTPKFVVYFPFLRLFIPRGVTGRLLEPLPASGEWSNMKENS